MDVAFFLLFLQTWTYHSEQGGGGSRLADDAMPVGSPGSKKRTQVKGGTKAPAWKPVAYSVAAHGWGERGGGGSSAPVFVVAPAVQRQQMFTCRL